MKVDVMDIFTDESAGKELTEAELAEREQRCAIIHGDEFSCLE